MEYSERGGLRIGKTYWKSWNLTWPFAVLRITEKEIQVRYLFRHLTLQKDDLFYIEPFKKGVRLVHNLAHHPFIVFWSRDNESLMERFRSRGYRIRIDHST